MFGRPLAPSREPSQSARPVHVMMRFVRPLAVLTTDNLIAEAQVLWATTTNCVAETAKLGVPTVESVPNAHSSSNDLEPRKRPFFFYLEKRLSVNSSSVTAKRNRPVTQFVGETLKRKPGEI